MGFDTFELTCALLSMAIVFLPGFLPQYGNWPIILLAFFWGGFTLTQYAICLAHANDRAESGDFVMVGSSMLLTQALFSAIGAPLSTVTMRWVEPSGLYVFFAVIMVCFAAAILFRRHFHKLSEGELHGEPFRVWVDLTTPAAYGLHPRTDESINPEGGGDADQVETALEPYTGYSPVIRDSSEEGGEDGGEQNRGGTDKSR